MPFGLRGQAQMNTENFIAEHAESAEQKRKFMVKKKTVGRPFRGGPAKGTKEGEMLPLSTQRREEYR